MLVPVRLSVLLCLLGVAPAFALTGRVVGADGTPLAGAEVSILGRSGSVVTDADGRFTWTPDPPLPFEILVVTSGGIFLKPQLVTALPAGEEPLVVTVEALASERVTVSGAAPDIEATPAAATTSLSQAELQTRHARQPGAGARERARREPGERRPGRRAGAARPVERPDPHPHRRRAREFRAPRRPERDVPGPRYPRGRGGGARHRAGGLRVRRLRRRDRRHHPQGGVRRAARGAPFGHARHRGARAPHWRRHLEGHG